MLCRGPLALGKGSETLGKGFAEGCPRQRPLGEFLDGEGSLPRARTALGKEKKPSRAGAVGGFFAEGRPSAKKWFFFEFFLPRAGPRQRIFKNPKNLFAEGQGGGPRQRFKKK